MQKRMRIRWLEEKEDENEEEKEKKRRRCRERQETQLKRKKKVVMGEVVRVFPANLLFHLCSPPALQPRPAKRHFTSHPHTHGARASTQKHNTHMRACAHALKERGHTPTNLHRFSLTHTRSHNWHLSI